MYVKFTPLIRKLENQLDIHKHLHLCMCTHTHNQRYRLITSVGPWHIFLLWKSVISYHSVSNMWIYIFIYRRVYIVCILTVVNLQKD